MVQLIVDHEYYASDYSARNQPHAANLLQTLHDSLVRHDRFAREREAAGKSCEDMDRARRLLQSLVCATNRRLHKGMPSIYAYLLGKPNHYSSHEFRGWSVQEMFEVFHGTVRDHWLNQEHVPDGRLCDAPAWFPPVTSSTAFQQQDHSKLTAS